MRLWTRFAGAGAATLAALIGCRLAANAFWTHAPAPHGIVIFGRNVEFVARLEAKRRITSELIAGRRTLLDAAAAFKALDADGRPCAVIPQIAWGGSEEETYCRMVIAWVRGEAPPARADALALPLEAELAARLRNGTLRLPD